MEALDAYQGSAYPEWRLKLGYSKHLQVCWEKAAWLQHPARPETGAAHLPPRDQHRAGRGVRVVFIPLQCPPCTGCLDYSTSICTSFRHQKAFPHSSSLKKGRFCMGQGGANLSRLLHI